MTGNTLVLRCERNHAERIVVGRDRAQRVARECSCGGEHTTRDTTVKVPS